MVKVFQAVQLLTLLAAFSVQSSLGRRLGGRHSEEEKTRQNEPRFLGKLDDSTRRKLAKSRYLAAGEGKIPGEYTIQFIQGQEQAGRALVDQLISEYEGAKLLSLYSNALVGASVAGVPDEGMKDFVYQHVEILKLVEEDSEVHASQSVTWGLDRIDQVDLPLDDTYDVGLDGSGVDIYILDTGVNEGHVEFTGRIGGKHSTVPGEIAGFDGNGHGTHVAGTAAGSTYGVAKGATIYGVKVLDSFGFGSDASVIEGIEWVITQAQSSGRKSVINMSLGGDPSSSLDDAVRNAFNAGIVVVVAAGNSAADACYDSPSREPTAITVGSTDNTDGLSDFSNHGSCVDILAPGSAITSAWIPNAGSTNTISGTSMASPHVAGVAALYFEQNPSASAANVASALTSFALNGKINSGSTLPAGTPNKLVYVGCLDGSCGPNPTDPVGPTDPTNPVNPTDPPPTGGTCVDYDGFLDSAPPPYQYSCDEYELYFPQGLCFDAHEYPDGAGVDANEACCWCGGGTNDGSTNPTDPINPTDPATDPVTDPTMSATESLPTDPVTETSPTDPVTETSPTDPVTGTPPTDEPCEDDVGWIDGWGVGCSWYRLNHYEGDCWDAVYFPDEQGVTANEACCWCRQAANPTPPSDGTCEVGDGGFSDVAGDTCLWYQANTWACDPSVCSGFANPDTLETACEKCCVCAGQ